MNNLISGLIGALLATIIALLYQHCATVAQLRCDLALEIVDWLNTMYKRIRYLHNQKESDYTSGKSFLSQEDYNLISREASSQLLSSALEFRIALVYGEERELELFQTIKSHMQEVLTTLWSANKDNWKVKGQNILETFDKGIEEKRKELESLLLRSLTNRIFISPMRFRKKK